MRYLEGDLFVDPGVFGQVDSAESATTKHGHDLVLSEDLIRVQHEERKYSRRPLGGRESLEADSRFYNSANASALLCS